jgi:hypothetical protein
MTEFKLDMSMMFAVHDALRRDLQHVVRLEARNEGWDLFQRMLHVHHGAEDDLLWPVMRAALTDRDELALLDQMKREHDTLLPLLDRLNRALDHGERATQAQVDLDTLLREHLAHEEHAALPLVDRILAPQQWAAFGKGSTERIGADMRLFVPWLLESADDDTTTRVLALIPAPVRQTFWEEWRPAYTAIDRWATTRPVESPTIL